MVACYSQAKLESIGNELLGVPCQRTEDTYYRVRFFRGFFLPFSGVLHNGAPFGKPCAASFALPTKVEVHGVPLHNARRQGKNSFSPMQFTWSQLN